MIAENPDLSDHAAKDVQRSFNTLHRFNPEFASDPTVAGAFVRKQMSLGEFDTKMLTEMIGARSNLNNVKKLPIPGHAPWESSSEREMSGLRLQEMQHKTSPEQLALEKRKMLADIGRSEQSAQSEPLRRQQMQSQINEKGIMGPLQLQKLRHESDLAPERMRGQKLKNILDEHRVAQDAAAGGHVLSPRARKALGLTP
jgi:hypothetical protein